MVAFARVLTHAAGSTAEATSMCGKVRSTFLQTHSTTNANREDGAKQTG